MLKITNTVTQNSSLRYIHKKYHFQSPGYDDHLDTEARPLIVEWRFRGAWNHLVTVVPIFTKPGVLALSVSLLGVVRPPTKH